jgi:hypothetical protein
MIPNAPTRRRSRAFLPVVWASAVVASSLGVATMSASAASPAPSAPTGLAAAVTGTSVTLKWNAVAGADGNDIYQDGAKIAWPGTATGLPREPTSYVVLNVTVGTHVFKVSSYNRNGEGPQSAPLQVSSVTAPGAPTGLAATVSGTSVTLNWKAVAGADGNDIYQDGAKIAWPGTASGLPGEPTSYVVLNVVKGSHSFAVSSYSRNGEGAQSAAVAAVVGAPTPPPPPVSTAPVAPTGLAANVSGTSVTLKWNAVSGADGNDIYEDSTKIAWPGTATGLSGEPTAYTAVGVAVGTHSFTVSSYNRNGEGAKAAAVQVSVTGTTPPVTTPPVTTPPVTTPPVTTPPSTSSIANIHAGEGFYPGDAAEPQQMQLFKQVQQQYNITAHYAVMMIDNTSDTAFRDSTWGHFIQAGAWKDYGPNRPTVVVSVPLSFGGFTPSANQSVANLQSVISGAHDGAYQYLASALVQAGYTNAVIRLGWEFDGNWMPWEATHNPGLYIAAFQHVHDIFAKSSSSFRYDWTGAAGQPFDGTQAYPGDRYVDIVGMDIYDLPGLNVASDLTSRQRFAQAHGKTVSFAEWALTNRPGDDPAFIQAMYNFFAALPASGGGSLAYQSYFLGNPGNDGSAPHSLNAYPKSMALYHQLFG